MRFTVYDGSSSPEMTDDSVGHGGEAGPAPKPTGKDFGHLDTGSAEHGLDQHLDGNSGVILQPPSAVR
jgi:hypothetical protein